MAGSDESAEQGGAEEKAIHLVEVPTGEEIALGMTAKVQEGMTLQAQNEGKAMTGKGKPPVSPPPKPSDAAVSAKPKQ
jgi:hypothetical protein